MVYCDRLAFVLNSHLKTGADDFFPKAGPINMDLHPIEGYFVSTKKTFGVTDINGKDYMVTIEEV